MPDPFTMLIAGYIASNAPHWREVILLLLGKLGRKPVTLRLKQILNGTIKSRRSRYTEIVQQDLFFVSDCLIEEITVESDLVEHVISLLSDVVLNSPFLSQSQDAARRLGQLMQTKQCAIVAEKEMKRLITSHEIATPSLKITIAETFYEISPAGSQENLLAAQSLSALAQPEFSIDQHLQALQALSQINFNKLREMQLVSQTLWDLIQSEQYIRNQLLCIVTIPIGWQLAPYVDKMQAILLVQDMHLSNDIEEHLMTHWKDIILYGEQIPDIPSIISLSLCKLLSPEIRASMYSLLRQYVSQFDQIPSVKVLD